MKVFKVINTSLLATIIVVLMTSSAFAIPSAELTYSETLLAGGLWEYDYTLFNTSDPVADAGYDLYDLFISFDPSAAFSVAAMPLGWDWIGDAGFVDVFSLNPGAAPTGADIGPGSFLSAFNFIFDQRIGPIPFDATLANPNDIDNPVVYSGTSRPASPASQVPEPSAIMLISMGLVGVGLVRKRFRN